MLKSHNKTIFETLGRKPIHPFPARMAPGIALEALGQSKRPMRVLDPMSGSGTVLAVAREHGHHAIGIDLDPLSVLTARVWTRPIDSGAVQSRASAVLARARLMFATMRTAEAYPVKSDDETRAFLRYWFDDYSRRQLTCLSHAIRRVRSEEVREALWCAFSRMIIAKSAGVSLAMDLPHSRPHRAYERSPVKPFTRFLPAVASVVASCPQIDSTKSARVAHVSQGDARELEVRTGSIDLVLTSPPYLNAIDYMRVSKFSLVWMGYTIGALRDIRARSVGTEASVPEAYGDTWARQLIARLRLKPVLDERRERLLATYAWDMKRALAETARVLRPGGKAVYVVGDSMSKGTFIPNSQIVVAAAEDSGFSLVGEHSRALPDSRRYMPPPHSSKAVSGALNRRMRKEVVLVFQR